MTNPDTKPTLELLAPGQPCTGVEIIPPRQVPLGGTRSMPVSRTLPSKKRSFVGAWCFLDHYGPDDVAQTGGMAVPRHPHTGLATVSWLFEGRVDHLDSGGNAAAVIPGELNLMIAGSGITHSEVSTAETTTLHGVQLWYAMPDATRFADNAFAHYRPTPVQLEGAVARVFIGSLFESTSPVVTRTPDLLGAEIVLDAGASLRIGVRRDFEHAVLAESGDVVFNGVAVRHRELGYAPTGADTIDITAGSAAARVILLGGVPFGEQIVMWWNFIGRSHDEVIEFRRRYQAELGFEPEHPDDAGKPRLFGDFPAGQARPLPAPPMPQVRLRPRA